MINLSINKNININLNKEININGQKKFEIEKIKKNLDSNKFMTIITIKESNRELKK